jgi:hypothetical protein
MPIPAHYSAQKVKSLEPVCQSYFSIGAFAALCGFRQTGTAEAS